MNQSMQVSNNMLLISKEQKQSLSDVLISLSTMFMVSGCQRGINPLFHSAALRSYHLPGTKPITSY